MMADEVKAYFAGMALLATGSTVVLVLAIIVALFRRLWWPLWVMLFGQVLDFLCDENVGIVHWSEPVRGLAMALTTLGICALIFKLGDKPE